MEYVELVIKISKENYKHIKEQVDKRDYPNIQIGRAIVEGVPLPKGHGELIDKNLTINEIEQAYKNSLSEPFAKLFVEFMTYIDDAHPIIEADKESEE